MVLQRITIIEGDITTQLVDAVVNAANESLLGGGGVDGAIHRAGGPEILEACIPLKGCPTGDAKITTAGNLPSTYVIHTVGPVYGGGTKGEAALLKRCYRRSLEVAVAHSVKTIAFPAISCGVYRYPLAEAARIAMETVAAFLAQDDTIEEVRFVLFGPAVFGAFREARDALTGA